MLYFHVTNGRVDGVTAEYPSAVGLGMSWLNRNDLKTFERATEVAAEATALGKGLFLPTDSGPNVSPRFDVIRAPAVGDAVSYAFNGDSYPCGKIVSISKTYRVITTAEETPGARSRSSTVVGSPGRGWWLACCW